MLIRGVLGPLFSVTFDLTPQNKDYSNSDNYFGVGIEERNLPVFEDDYLKSNLAKLVRTSFYFKLTGAIVMYCCVVILRCITSIVL